MEVEKKIHDYFDGRIFQVFLYITDRCNIDCRQCLYKPDRTFSFGSSDMSFETGRKLLHVFYQMGARKLTLLGGEPTLHKDFYKFAEYAKAVGYDYIRIDTNGQFQEDVIAQGQLDAFDEITFSLDGHRPEINDALRGKGTFKLCKSRIEQAVQNGIPVQVTSCLHKTLAQKDMTNEYPVIDMIKFFLALGVDKCNFHSMVKTGVARDTWSGDDHTTIEDYMAVYDAIEGFKQTLLHDQYEKIRVPKGFEFYEKFKRSVDYYSYCSAKQADRVLIFPNQMIRLCSLMIGTPYCVGYYDEKSVSWNHSPTNELRYHKLDTDTPCTNQNKSGWLNGVIPLCVSFKPKQDEFVWKNHLNWEALLAGDTNE